MTAAAAPPDELSVLIDPTGDEVVDDTPAGNSAPDLDRMTGSLDM